MLTKDVSKCAQSVSQALYIDYATVTVNLRCQDAYIYFIDEKMESQIITASFSRS